MVLLVIRKSKGAIWLRDSECRGCLQGSGTLSLVVWVRFGIEETDHEEVLRKMSLGKEAESKFPDRFLLEVGLNSS